MVARTALSSITDVHDNASNSADNSNRRQQLIYGRDKETAQLLRTYQKFLETKQTQQVFVHGVPGAGKSSFVETVLRGQVCASNDGYFVAGKYDQNSSVHQEPYSAIMAAFSDLCDLIAQSDDFDEVRKKGIQDLLGNDAHLLVNSITNLAQFISNAAAGERTINMEAMDPSFAKFKRACTSFLRAMSTDKHPIVVFLDDIQWVDEGSRQLLETFLEDAGLNNIMFILTYRDEELSQVVDLIEHAQNPVDIALANLDVSAIHKMVTSILGSTADSIRRLSHLVAKRSTGNPLHAKMLVESMQQRGLLTFDNGSQNWIFDMETIQIGIMISETLADLLTRKIETISPAMKEYLKVASILGYRFHASILVQVACNKVTVEYEHINDDDASACNEGLAKCTKSVFSSLAEAVKDGFIETTTADGYHFTHDKVQSAFQYLIDEHEKRHLHHRIGQAYLSFTRVDTSAIYSAAVHLNISSDFATTNKKKAKLAQVNLDAAKYCEGKSAFASAAILLGKGLDALGDRQGRWSKETFELTSEIMVCLARIQLIVGNFDECKQTIEEALRHVTTISIKIQFLLIDVEVRAVRTEFSGGVSVIHRALLALGMKMPRKVSIGHVMVRYLKVKRLLRRKSDDDLLCLPIVQDPLANTAVKLLMHLLQCYFNFGSKKAGAFSGLLAVELTLEKGLSPYSSFAFAMYGIAELSLGNTNLAYRFGKLATNMLVRMHNQEAVCPTVGFTSAMLTCWKEPLRELIDPLFQAGKFGCKSGDMIYGNLCLCQSYAMHLHIGTHLETLEDSMRDTYTMLFSMGHDGLLLWNQPYLQHVVNMRSDVRRWDHAGMLSGEIMDETIYFRNEAVAKNPKLKMVALKMKAQEAVFFNRYDFAVSMYEEIESIGGDCITFGAPSVCWLAALANTEVFLTSGKRRYLRRSHKYKKRLTRMHSNGCPNVAPYLVFLEVELASRRPSIDEAKLRTMYDKGIARMAESNLVHLEGMLNELAGFDFVNRGRHTDAQRYFRQGLNIYKNKWGAIAKYLWLRERSAMAFEANEDNEMERTLYGQCIKVVQNEELK